MQIIMYGGRVNARMYLNVMIAVTLAGPARAEVGASVAAAHAAVAVNGLRPSEALDILTIHFRKPADLAYLANLRRRDRANDARVAMRASAPIKDGFAITAPNGRAFEVTAAAGRIMVNDRALPNPELGAEKYVAAAHAALKTRFVAWRFVLPEAEAAPIGMILAYVVAAITMTVGYRAFVNTDYDRVLKGVMNSRDLCRLEKGSGKHFDDAQSSLLFSILTRQGTIKGDRAEQTEDCAAVTARAIAADEKASGKTFALNKGQSDEICVQTKYLAQCLVEYRAAYPKAAAAAPAGSTTGR